MKVVCDACQAKYQIPDERVAGRKLKIRCRKCGNAIVVRGEQASGEVQTISSIPPAEAPREVEWHVSIDGEQHGPYPTDQMGSMLRAGQLAWDSYVWRETYGDWRAAGDSDTLVRAVAASAEDEGTATAQVQNPAAFDSSAPALRGGASSPPSYIDDEDPTRMAQSPTGENLQPVARVAFAARARATSQPPMAAVGYGGRASQVPMNGGYASAQAFSSSAAPAASYAPRAVSQPATGYNGPRPVSQVPTFENSESAYSRRAEPALTGERNEDSVLFSAHNLALAASPGNSTPPAPSSQSGGYASGEGSGLIDIRALAALAQTQHAQSQQAPSLGARPPLPGIEQNVRSTDAMMRMANQTGAFSHLDSLAPIGRESQTPNRAVPLAILGGSAMIAAAAFLALYIFRPQPVQQPAAAASTVGIAEPAAPLAAPTPEPEPAAAAPAVEPVAAKAQPEPAAEPADEPAPAPAARSTKSSKTVSAKRAAAPVEHAAKPSKADARAAKEAKEPKESEPAAKEKPASLDDVMLGDSGKKSEPKPEPKPAAAGTPDDDLLAGPMPAPKKDASKPRSIDDLLDDAVPAKGAAKSAAASEALPETPSREQVGAAMHDITPDVKACAEGQEVESPTAQVAITVTGATGKVTSVRVTGIQGNVGSCIARAVRNASFPKFAKASLSINYPFKLK
jgi:predicted Zn finger-like uncharacterized protein